MHRETGVEGAERAAPRHFPDPPPAYLKAYPAPLVDQVARMMAQGTVGEHLLRRYPDAHAVRTDKALYDYVLGLKDAHLRSAGPLSKALFDNRLVLGRVLGTHTRISRVQGSKLTSKREIRVATVFRNAPEAFLRMIVVHELAHIRERDHGKAFYQLCEHMAPDYAQLEFDLRVYLSYLDADGAPLWAAPGIAL